MIKIEWDFNPDDWADEIAKAALREVMSRYQRVLGELRCSEHQESITLVVKRVTAEGANAQMKACCQNLMDQANALLVGEGFEVTED